MKYDFFTKIDYANIKDWADFRKQEDAHFDKEMKKSRALPDGLQIADGYAYYQVEKIGKKSVKIKWREDLCPDGYKDRILGTGGSFQTKIVESLILREEAINRIFAKKV